MSNIPFTTIDWATVDSIEHKGELGTSYWQTQQLEGIRTRIVVYTPGYIADH